MLSNFYQKSLGILITAGALGFGLMLGSGHGFAQDAAKDAAKPQGPQPKDTQEYNMAKAAQDEKDPKKQLDDLDAWKKAYPTTELVDARNGFYLQAYMGLKMAREAFDMAQQFVKAKPTALIPLYDALQVVTLIKPAPTPADLDAGEKDAITVLDDPGVFAPENKLPGLNDAQWAKTQTDLKTFAKKVLLQLYAIRDAKDNKRAIDDLTHLITRDPSMATAAYQLGTVMQAQFKVTNNTDDLPPEFWQFARAIDVASPDFALPAATKTGATKFLTDAYTAYHGSTEGLQDLLAQAKNAPFPPAGWTLKSKVDIAKEQIAKDEAARAADPLGTLWREDIKGNLIKDGGEAFFDMNLKDAELPGPDPNDKSDKPAPRYFNATIISMTPATRPKEVMVAIEKPDVADAKLVFETALPGKMDAGEKIRFKGVPKSFTKDPFVITFEVDQKEDLDGSWTGKNAPGRGAAGAPKGGAGAPKGGAPKAPAPKQ